MIMADNNYWKRVAFRNSRGLTLAGLLYGSPEETGDIVIHCHGFTGSKEGGGRALELGAELGRRGWSTLVFDFAGNGESEGDFADITLSGQVDDLTCAVDWVLKQGYKRIVTVGRSFGGSTVICQGARDPRVAGVCTWAAPARLIDLFASFTGEPIDGPEEMVAIAGERGIIYLKKAFFQDLKIYDVPGDAARLAPRPLLIIHGTRDGVVPPEDARLISDAAGEPRELAWIEEGDHQFAKHYHQVWKTLFYWLDKHFKRPVP
ncbi:putative redox protein [Desulfofundulus luciae]|uniref:Redox protein n=2 Tax=Desulfofundulus luciae TaxID=74702 RepID=A0ABU0B0R8_9FIRM|nr:putative redox protein [Desulfofundulus luciae]